MNAQFVCIPLYKEFDNLFTSTFPSKVLDGFSMFCAFQFHFSTSSAGIIVLCYWLLLFRIMRIFLFI